MVELIHKVFVVIAVKELDFYKRINKNGMFNQLFTRNEFVVQQENYVTLKRSQ